MNEFGIAIFFVKTRFYSFIIYLIDTKQLRFYISFHATLGKLCILNNFSNLFLS